MIVLDADRRSMSHRCKWRKENGFIQFATSMDGSFNEVGRVHERAATIRSTRMLCRRQKVSKKFRFVL